MNFHSYGRNLCLIRIRSGRAADPHTRVGKIRTDFARHLFVDSGRYVSRITEIIHSSGNDKIHIYCRRNGVLPCGVPKFYILAFAEFRAGNLHVSFKHVCFFGQFIVFFRLKIDADAVGNFLLDKLIFNSAPRKRRAVFSPQRCRLPVFGYKRERCGIVCADGHFERSFRFILEFKRGGKTVTCVYLFERHLERIDRHRVGADRLRIDRYDAENYRKAHSQPQCKREYPGFSCVVCHNSNSFYVHLLCINFFPLLQMRIDFGAHV